MCVNTVAIVLSNVLKYLCCFHALKDRKSKELKPFMSKHAFDSLSEAVIGKPSANPVL